MKVGPYPLLETLGKGAMGVVHASRHPSTGNAVAVKVMAKELTKNPILLKRFEAECRAAMSLEHPNIVRGLDFGVAEDRPYLVMEFIDGDNLADRVTHLGPLSEAEVVRIGCEVGLALELAHSRGMIHRDVKPDNILLTKSGISKLADLGLIKDLNGEEELTRSGTWVGTIAYMAPEQFGDAKHVDARCDVYGLAATLYYALTGINPFPQGGGLTVLGNKMKNQFQPPRQLAPTISEHLNDAICQGLDANQDRRPTSCRELVERLRGAKESAETVREQPTPEEPDEPERRRARRYPTAVSAYCAAVHSGKDRWFALVRDVSVTGLRLEIDRRFEPATVLELRVSNDAFETSSVFLARVCWAREWGPKSWCLGCAFGSKLTEGDLGEFLKHAASTVVVQPAS